MAPSVATRQRWGATDSADLSPPTARRKARHAVGRRCRALILACTVLAAACALAAPPAGAAPRATDGYFVEFRSRPGYLFGHTYIVYGRLDARGRTYDTHLAGIYPTDGEAGLIMGSLVPVQASVRGVGDDFRERPTNIYRKRLTPAQYAQLLRVVGALKRSEREWDLLFKNCNDFAIAVAKGMDMTTPPSWLLPYYFVGGLRVLNGP